MTRERRISRLDRISLLAQINSYLFREKQWSLLPPRVVATYRQLIKTRENLTLRERQKPGLPHFISETIKQHIFHRPTQWVNIKLRRMMLLIADKISKCKKKEWERQISSCLILKTWIPSNLHIKIASATWSRRMLWMKESQK